MTVGPLWLLAFGVAAVLVRVGLAVLTCGSVDRRLATAVVWRAAAEAAAGTLAFWLVGAALLYGRVPGGVRIDTAMIGTQSADVADRAAGEVYHWAAVLIAGGIVSGAVAGRGKARVAVAASVVLAGMVVPVLGRWVWFGWLRQRDMLDFGGATAVQLSGAVFAAVAAAGVGRRADRAGPSWPTVAGGLAVVMVGWVPYLLGGVTAHRTLFNTVDGTALAITAFNVPLAAAAGLVGGAAYTRIRRRLPGQRAEPFCLTVGVLAGAVAVSAGCFAVGNLGAVLIGLLAGAVAPAVAEGFDRVGLDDPTGLVAAHGVGAVWGTVAAAAFAANQSADRRAQVQLFGVQLLGLVVVLVVAGVAAAATVAGLRLFGPLSDPAVDERHPNSPV